MKGKCSNCMGEFDLVKGLIPYHDHPKPFRGLCRGAKQRPWSRRECIINVVEDTASNLMHYDRKEDEDLPCGAIEEAVKAGEISWEKIVDVFKDSLPIKDEKEVLYSDDGVILRGRMESVTLNCVVDAGEDDDD